MPDPWELTPPTFGDWRKATKWAWHLARTSQRKCQVRKIDGRWRVLRART